MVAAGNHRNVAVVAGALANQAGNGGEAWVRPTWTVGLTRIGFDAWLVEELPPAGDGEPDPDAVAWFDAVTRRFGLQDRAALLCDGRSVLGPPAETVGDVLAAARLLLNVSGHLPDPARRAPDAVRVHVDLDPGFTQCWADDGLLDLDGHDAFVTVGTNVGAPDCGVPDAGRRWITTPPPVLLDEWDPTPPPAPPPRFRTVGSWRPPHGPLRHRGRTWGVKAHEFRRFVGLPARTGATIELALSIHPADDADRARMEAAGFELCSPAEAAGSPDDFAAFVRGSWGEWSVAQGVYVGLRTGWVSDRSAHFLAAGRPVVVQDTGAALPAGGGYLTFSDLDEAADRIAEVVRDPAGHGRAARALAEEHLEATAVLGRLCDRLGVGP